MKKLFLLFSIICYCHVCFGGQATFIIPWESGTKVYDNHRHICLNYFKGYDISLCDNDEYVYEWFEEKQFAWLCPGSGIDGDIERWVSPYLSMENMEREKVCQKKRSEYQGLREDKTNIRHLLAIDIDTAYTSRYTSPGGQTKCKQVMSESFCSKKQNVVLFLQVSSVFTEFVDVKLWKETVKSDGYLMYDFSENDFIHGNNIVYRNPSIKEMKERYIQLYGIHESIIKKVSNKEDESDSIKLLIYVKGLIRDELDKIQRTMQLYDGYRVTPHWIYSKEGDFSLNCQLSRKKYKNIEFVMSDCSTDNLDMIIQERKLDDKLSVEKAIEDVFRLGGESEYCMISKVNGVDLFFQNDSLQLYRMEYNSELAVANGDDKIGMCFGGDLFFTFENNEEYVYKINRFGHPWSPIIASTIKRSKD